MIYTGIGARKTPENTLKRLRHYGSALADIGFTLRSGGADGADTAFEEGCDAWLGKKEIYLPWKGFNKHTSSLYTIPPKAFEYAADVYGPSWKYLKKSIKMLMARNIQQILGQNLDIPSSFVLCWTKDGCINKQHRTDQTGGTGQAIACASELHIPVYNFQRNNEEKKFINFLQDFLE